MTADVQPEGIDLRRDLRIVDRIPGEDQGDERSASVNRREAVLVRARIPLVVDEVAIAVDHLIAAGPGLRMAPIFRTEVAVVAFARARMAEAIAVRVDLVGDTVAIVVLTVKAGLTLFTLGQIDRDALTVVQVLAAWVSAGHAALRAVDHAVVAHPDRTTLVRHAEFTVPGTDGGMFLAVRVLLARDAEHVLLRGRHADVVRTTGGNRTGRFDQMHGAIPVILAGNGLLPLRLACALLKVAELILGTAAAAVARNALAFVTDLTERAALAVRVLLAFGHLAFEGVRVAGLRFRARNRLLVAVATIVAPCGRHDLAAVAEVAVAVRVIVAHDAVGEHDLRVVVAESTTALRVDAGAFAGETRTGIVHVTRNPHVFRIGIRFERCIFRVRLGGVGLYHRIGFLTRIHLGDGVRLRIRVGFGECVRHLHAGVSLSGCVGLDSRVFARVGRFTDVRAGVGALDSRVLLVLQGGGAVLYAGAQGERHHQGKELGHVDHLQVLPNSRPD